MIVFPCTLTFLKAAITSAECETTPSGVIYPYLGIADLNPFKFEFQNAVHDASK